MTLQSSNPVHNPIIEPNYLDHPEDRAALIEVSRRKKENELIIRKWPGERGRKRERERGGEREREKERMGEESREGKIKRARKRDHRERSL